MSKHATFLHFYTTLYTPNDYSEVVKGEPSYSWYLESQDGTLLGSSDRRWLTKAEVIANATETLGEDFWLEHTVIQDEWFQELVGQEVVESAAKFGEGIFAGQDTTRADFTVELVDHAGSDLRICQAARVSTVGADAFATEESQGLINFLLANKHGSPFEHGMMTFRIHAPIFVWREFMRHRIGFSYNEESGRYKELESVSYIPNANRNLIQVGKTGAYSFEKGSDAQYALVLEQLCLAYDQAWSSYHTMLDAGICKEVARVCLPVATYSTAYVTCNPRSLMSFLSLRTSHPEAKFPSSPQWEISDVANQMEAIFADLYPLTHKAYMKAGRVAP